MVASSNDVSSQRACAVIDGKSSSPSERMIRVIALKTACIYGFPRRCDASLRPPRDEAGQNTIERVLEFRKDAGRRDGLKHLLIQSAMSLVLFSQLREAALKRSSCGARQSQ